MKKILLIIIVIFASLQDNVTAQTNDSIDSVKIQGMIDTNNQFIKEVNEGLVALVGAERAKVITDSLNRLRRTKPLICVVDTTTLSNPFVVQEQYRSFVFDSIPDKLSRRNMDKVLKENDWYVLCGSDIYDYSTYNYLDVYGNLYLFVEDGKVSLEWDKKNKWWTGRFDDPNQLFLVVLINVELLNSVYYDVEWKSMEYDYSKAKRHYPSYNPKASFVKMLLPIERSKYLPL